MDNAIYVGLSRQMSSSASSTSPPTTSPTSTPRLQVRRFAVRRIPDAGARATCQAAPTPVSYVHDRATFRDFGQGALDRTGEPLDVAINGRGFLRQTPRGTGTPATAASNGCARQDRDQDGDPVVGNRRPDRLPEGTVTSASRPTARSPRGKARAVRTRARRLQLVSLANPSQLRRRARASTPPTAAQPAADPKVRVVQGSVEESNVNASELITRLIEMTRATPTSPASSRNRATSANPPSTGSAAA